MVNIRNKLQKLNIDPESEFGEKLIHLDSVYATIDSIGRKVKQLIKEQQQLKEDAELMELVLMHKLNTDTRNATQWDSKNMQQ